MQDNFFHANLVENKEEEEKSDSLVHGYSVYLPLLNTMQELETIAQYI